MLLSSPLASLPAQGCSGGEPVAIGFCPRSGVGREMASGYEKGVFHLRGWKTPVDEAFRIVVRTLADSIQPGPNLDQFFFGTDQSS